MNKKNLWPFITVLIFMAVVSFLLVKNDAYQKIKTERIKYVKIEDVKLQVDLALTPEAQAQGLSGRSGLGEDEGMLFVFNRPDKYLFWMKNMNFAIDIIWIAGEDFRDLRIVYIKKDARPELYLETYGPDKNAKYVLEVISGFSEKNNLKEGDKVEFTF